jgi:hypothetical protein
MAMFQHPHLTRGVVRTHKGSFVITRGLVSAPDEIGDSLGWRRIDVEAEPPVSMAPRQVPMPRDARVAMDRP